MVKIDNTFTL